MTELCFMENLLPESILLLRSCHDCVTLMESFSAVHLVDIYRVSQRNVPVSHEKVLQSLVVLYQKKKFFFDKWNIFMGQKASFWDARYCCLTQVRLLDADRFINGRSNWWSCDAQIRAEVEHNGYVRPAGHRLALHHRRRPSRMALFGKSSHWYRVLRMKFFL